MSFPKLSLLVLDTETTGFVPKIHRVVEYAAMQIKDGEMIKEYESLFSIPGEIPPHVEILTRINTSDLKGQPTFEEKKAEIEAMLTPDTIIVGQNIGFDIGMLKGEGLDLSGYECIDTSMLASIVFPEFESYSLGFMSEMLKVDHTPKHRALGDVRATAGVLAACVKRLSELPSSTIKEIQVFADRGPEGYKKFFASITGSDTKKMPAWLTIPTVEKFKPERAINFSIGAEPPKVAELVEESLDPAYIEEILHSAQKNSGKRHFVAVKNLEATMRRIDMPKGTSVLYAPHLLLDAESAAKFLAQETFSKDELILAIKLMLYKPLKQADIPLHGEEQHVWAGLLACNFESAVYIEQIKNLTDVILLDHRQLLSHIEMENLPPETTHIVFDDASMLEDTATRAFGWYVTVAALRKAAENDAALTKFTDLLQLWIEQVRNGTDIRYLVKPDLESRESTGLNEQLKDLLTQKHSEQVQNMLETLQKVLDSNNLPGRFAWIEVYQNGDQCVQSVPESIAVLLRDRLFANYSTTLLIPPKTDKILGAILPRGLETKVIALPPAFVQEAPMDFPETFDLNAWITHVTGKSILLVGSRRVIEELYIKHALNSEARGLALFCQGMSGGQSRMQAEFAAVKGDALLITTPWNYEGFELPPHSVDRLVIQTLPFDHPSHAVIGRRSEQFNDPFNEYSLPRVMHRMFRLLRTYCRHRKPSGTIAILDARLRTKEYGKIIRRYMEQFALKESKAPTVEAPVVTEKIEKKAPPKPRKKKAADEPPKEQQTLF